MRQNSRERVRVGALGFSGSERADKEGDGGGTSPPLNLGRHIPVIEPKAFLYDDIAAYHDYSGLVKVLSPSGAARGGPQ